MKLRLLVLGVLVSAFTTTMIVRQDTNYHLTRRVGQLQETFPSKRPARTMCSPGNCSRTTLEVGGSTIDVEFGPGHLDLPITRLTAWVEAAARAVSCYYGR